MDSVTVKELVDAVGLTVYSGDKHLEDRKIATDDISRPGLELTGYFDYYPQERVQLFGMTEISYAHKMDPEERLEVMDKLCGE
ncbi:MAG: HPr kinase/phosphorylase, partial [Ligilactobacillus ruminis]